MNLIVAGQERGVEKLPSWNDLNGGQLRHIVSMSQFSRPLLDELFERAAWMNEHMIVDRHGVRRLHMRKIAVTAFYEPSTRTHHSFQSAAIRLGMNVIPTDHAKITSSRAKGENLFDTLKNESAYGDVIIVRHDETGMLPRAVWAADVPVINAGDGKGEHPTQTLLDLYTMQKRFGRIDGLRIALVGDLARGRTVHSLARAAQFYQGMSLLFVAGEQSQMPAAILEELDSQGIEYGVTEDINAAMMWADVSYITRVQRERFQEDETGRELYERERERYTITPEMVGLMPEDAILMHPLPQVGELEQVVHREEFPQVHCFKQSANGVPTRMALLDYVLTGRP